MLFQLSGHICMLFQLSGHMLKVANLSGHISIWTRTIGTHLNLVELSGHI